MSSLVVILISPRYMVHEGCILQILASRGIPVMRAIFLISSDAFPSTLRKYVVSLSVDDVFEMHPVIWNINVINYARRVPTFFYPRWGYGYTRYRRDWHYFFFWGSIISLIRSRGSCLFYFKRFVFRKIKNLNIIVLKNAQYQIW